MEKINKKIICISIIVLGAAALFHMIKSSSLIQNALIDEELYALQAAGMKGFVYLLLVLSVAFVLVTGYKFFRLREREHIYAVGIICAVLLFVTAANGVTFLGRMGSSDIGDTDLVKMVTAFFLYMGGAKVSGYMYLGTSIWVIVDLLKSNPKAPKAPEAVESEGFMGAGQED